MPSKFPYTQKTLAYLRDRGMRAWIVEKYVRFGKFGVRQDAFGFGDILAFGLGDGTVLVQSTSRQGLSAHLRTILEIREAFEWLQQGNRIWAIGWEKERNRWKPIVKNIDLSMFDLKKLKTCEELQALRKEARLEMEKAKSPTAESNS